MASFPYLALHQGPTVTIAPTIARVEAHLAAFPKGEKPYRADKAIAGDTVAVRFDGTTVAVAKEMLAKALRAQWREEKDAWVLFRTPETLKAFETEEYALRENSLRFGISEAIKKREKPVDLEATATIMNGIIRTQRSSIPTNELENSPMNRLGFALAAELDPRTVARLPMRHRLTFSSVPNGPHQRPMTAKMMAAVKEYWTDTAKLRKLIEFPPEKKGETWPSFYNQIFGIGETSGLTPGKVLLELVRHPEQGLVPSVKAVDQNGTCIMTTIIPLPGPSETVTLPKAIPDVRLTPKDPPRAQIANDAWQSRYGDPVAVDPLEMVWGEMFRAMAAKSRADICLMLTDRELRQSDNSRAAFSSLLQGKYELQADEDRWVGTPARLFSKRALSPSRFALRDLAKRTTKWSSPTMRQWADFYRSVPQGFSALASGWFMQRTGFPLGENGRMAAYIGELLSFQGVHTGTIPLTGELLSPSMLEEMRKMTFDFVPILRDEPSEPTAFDAFEMRLSGASNAQLTFNLTFGWQEFNVVDMGMRMAVRERRDLFVMDQVQDVNIYRGALQRWNLVKERRWPDGRLTTSFQSEIATWSASSKPTSFDQLDEETRAKITGFKNSFIESRGIHREGRRQPPPNEF